MLLKFLRNYLCVLSVHETFSVGAKGFVEFCPWGQVKFLFIELLKFKLILYRQ